ncbi:hypothetical protein [Rhizobium rhizogenes]|uniref:hypothetical protein n=1 Tax=Rhizobium rhizogenes TaxID=359 RepID=UPI001574011D|nr:hypothetical protein [Rhizobium rhizogenes]NTG09243.1 hypothetical protein [Rhizobium rhizogenes]
MIIRKRNDGKFEVTDESEFVAGPFDTHDNAIRWIEANRHQTKRVLPEDIRRAANHIEAAYLQRRASEDLAYLIGAAILDERQRCRELALGMSRKLVKLSGGLMRRPTFEYLADAISRGDVE